jgi:hypothetical protein
MSTYAGGHFALANSFTSQNRAGVVRFDSLYESFQALTSIQVSHFVEWFSGADLNAIWTKSNYAGSGTFAMNDSIDGGFRITCGASGGNFSGIDFNDKRHYDPADCIMIMVAKAVSVSLADKRFGLKNAKAGASGTQVAQVSQVPANANFNLQTGDGSASTTATAIAKDTNWHTFKIECGSANIKLTMDGVLEVTKTTNRPTSILQPRIAPRQDGGAGSIDIRFLEVYNNSISILSSLYERLSALTQVSGQRVVETFAGAAIQSDRWTKTDIVSTGNTFAMGDGIDSGATFVSNSTSVGSFNFNNKRHYDPTDSVIIFVVRQEAINYDTNFGFSNTTTVGAAVNSIHVNQNQSLSFMQLRSGDGTTTSSDSTVAPDLSAHSFKIEGGSANIKLTIDGVLEVTKTTNRPTIKQQPILVHSSNNSAAIVHITYIEAYNKLTTETDYPSVYELFNPLTTVAKSHFWEWFDGNDIDTDRWSLRSIAGITGAMDDAVDGGYKLTAGAGGNDRGDISFNDLGQFDLEACELTTVNQSSSITNVNTWVGILLAIAQNDDFGYFGNISSLSGSKYSLNTHDGSTTSAAASSSDMDTNWHVMKLIFGADDVLAYVDGVLEITKTTNRPTGNGQPVVWCNATSASARTHSVRYLEAKNT